jgi:hypothetical protein
MLRRLVDVEGKIQSDKLYRKLDMSWNVVLNLKGG